MVDLTVIEIWLWIEIIASVIVIIGYVLWNIPTVILVLKRIYRQYYTRKSPGGKGDKSE